MKILFLSFYFKPDLSAGSFRATAAIAALKELLPADSQVDVLTTCPNRYQSFSATAPAEERDGALYIRRIQLPQPQRGTRGQMRAFIHYAREVRRIVADQQYDLVYATSSRLMTAALGSSIATRIRAPLYLDIRDLFVDTIGDILPKPAAFLAKPFFSLVERKTFSTAAHINLVSAGFGDYVSRRAPGVPVSFFTNGVDDEFRDYARCAAAPRRSAPIRVLYAGNIGEGQGLETILPPLARRLGTDVTFRVIGDGGRKSALAEAVAPLPNVELLSPVKREDLLEEYQAADILFLHLNDYPAFLKVLPSKLFEYAATGKPILAGLKGYSADFVRQEVSNAAVFNPCDTDAAARGFASLSLADVDRRDFVIKYARNTIMRALARNVIEIANASK